MPINIRNGLVTIGIGLIIGFFGLIFVANLFGVADEHARMISENPRHRWVAREQGSPAEVRNSPRFRRSVNAGRFLAGGGFMVFGLALIISGIVILFSPPAE